jgi:hypothetical protein
VLQAPSADAVTGENGATSLVTGVNEHDEKRSAKLALSGMAISVIIANADTFWQSQIRRVSDGYVPSKQDNDFRRAEQSDATTVLLFSKYIMDNRHLPDAFVFWRAECVVGG